MERIALLAIAAALAAPAAADRTPCGIEEFFRAVELSDPAVSPDGARVAYVASWKDLPRARSGSDLWVVETSGGEARRLTFSDDVDESDPAFSPDGAQLAFVSRRGEQTADQIWLLPVAGGEARPLTDLPGGAAHPKWSPDGTRIALVSDVYPACGADAACNRERRTRRTAGKSKAYVADELLYRHWETWNEGRVPHVLVVDVASGAVRDLTPGDLPAPAVRATSGTEFAWSPDGAELAYTRNVEPRERHAWSTNTDVLTVPYAATPDGSTAVPRNATAANLAWDTLPKYSPDGRYLAYLSQARPGYESDLVRLTLQDRRTGAVTYPAHGFDDWVVDFAWFPDSKELLFQAEVRAETPLYRVAVNGGRAREVARFAQIDAFAMSPDGAAAYAVRRSTGEPEELWRIDLRNGATTRRTRHNEALERDVELRPAERVWVETAPGRKIEVLLIKPRAFDAARRYPAIVNVHGGPQSQWADAFRGDSQVYPAAGYVVALPNPAGSTGYGQARVDEIAGDWGGQVFRDVVAVAEWLAAQPYVDPERLGAMGWSYGGYMMHWLQGRTTRFKTLASMMGLFDLPTFHLTTEELWFPEWDLGGPPWASEHYARWNPASNLADWNTPMLVVTGQQDFRVPYTQSLAAFTTLRRKGVPARLVVFPDAGHWPGWYDMALYYTAHLEWFHEQLGGAPPPWTTAAFAANAVWDPKTGERLVTPSANRE